MAPHSITGILPYELIMGRYLCTHLDLLRPDVYKLFISIRWEWIRSFKSSQLVIVRNFRPGDDRMCGIWLSYKDVAQVIIHCGIKYRDWSPKKYTNKNSRNDSLAYCACLNCVYDLLSYPSKHSSTYSSLALLGVSCLYHKYRRWVTRTVRE